MKPSRDIDMYRRIGGFNGLHLTSGQADGQFHLAAQLPMPRPLGANPACRAVVPGRRSGLRR